ncbi:MAG TPA: hypothetical protein VER12_13225 [Polyangiaceae bacterium]|nr:hypothetical protein [Polyangiaceae bacterium]
MATKKSDAVLRGAALIKKAIETGKSVGKLAEPEPVPANVLKKLKLPNDEKLSPGLKELLAFDASFLGWSIDEEDPELEPMALDELVEQEYGEEFVPRFGEALELLGDDCLLVGQSGDARHFLYIGVPDDKGEYPVITLDTSNKPWVGGFVPFDVWIAQQLGALEAAKQVGEGPPGYETSCKALAESNGDGRVQFEPETRTVDRDGADNEEDDEDEEEDKDEASSD